MSSTRIVPWMPSWARTLAHAVRSPEVRQDLIHEYRRRRGGEPLLPPGPIRNVVVVCCGNICRSAFAGVLLAKRNPQLEVRSAGIAAREGAPAEPEACRTAREFGVELSGHAAVRLDAGYVAWADLILGMQGRHPASILRRWPQSADKMRLLGDFLENPPHAIEDPWGHGDAVFHSVFARIALAIERVSELIGSPAR